MHLGWDPVGDIVPNRWAPLTLLDYFIHTDYMHRNLTWVPCLAAPAVYVGTNKCGGEMAGVTWLEKGDPVTQMYMYLSDRMSSPTFLALLTRNPLVSRGSWCDEPTTPTDEINGQFLVSYMVYQRTRITCMSFFHVDQGFWCLKIQRCGRLSTKMKFLRNHFLWSGIGEVMVSKMVCPSNCCKLTWFLFSALCLVIWRKLWSQTQ